MSNIKIYLINYRNKTLLFFKRVLYINNFKKEEFVWQTELNTLTVVEKILRML